MSFFIAPKGNHILFSQEQKISNFWTGRGSVHNDSGYSNINPSYNSYQYDSLPRNTVYCDSQPQTTQPLIGHLIGDCPVGPCASGPFTYHER